MLPSMYSPVESETFPPDVCYSGEASRPTGWAQSVVSDLSSTSEHSIAAHCGNIDNAEDALQSLSEEHSPSDNELVLGDVVEGAVGGGLPDLCVTGTLNINGSYVTHAAESVTDDNLYSASQVTELEIEYEDHLEDGALVVRPDALLSGGSESLAKQNTDTNNLVQKSDLIAGSSDSTDLADTRTYKTESDEFLVHNCKHICVVSCGTGDVNQDLDLHADNKEDLKVPCSESQVSVCCDKIGALDKLSDLRTYGIELVRQNLLHSSHPLYYSWECSAVIPSYLLSPFSLHSHGTSLGCDAGSSYIVGFSGRAHPNEAVPQLSEDEQIKIAKRYGLITHLPCGIFDGSTKTRECVICMIDFSVGDKIRYLPCMHTYHTECIDDWLMRSFTCPSCLEPVDAALLSTYETS